MQYKVLADTDLNYAFSYQVWTSEKHITNNHVSYQYNEIIYQNK
jgi:hypothetical protein